MREKEVNEKFHKSIAEVVDSTNPLLLMITTKLTFMTAFFPPERRGNLILIVDGATNIIF